MKVKEIISRIESVEKCIGFLERTCEKTECGNADIVADIGKLLYDYCELLENMEVKWTGRSENEA